jgi:hypothetical protein
MSHPRAVRTAGSLDDYLLFTKEKDIDSEVGMKLRKLIVEKWEQKNGRKFNRRRELYLQKLQVLLADGKITQAEYDECFQKSDPRMQRLYKIAEARVQEKLGKSPAPSATQAAL